MASTSSSAGALERGKACLRCRSVFPSAVDWGNTVDTTSYIRRRKMVISACVLDLSDEVTHPLP